jgi:hypothetical protein
MGSGFGVWSKRFGVMVMGYVMEDVFEKMTTSSRWMVYIHILPCLGILHAASTIPALCHYEGAFGGTSYHPLCC